MDQKGDRVSTIGSVDVVDTMKIQDNLDRYSREDDQKKKQYQSQTFKGEKEASFRMYNTTNPREEEKICWVIYGA